ncbi:MAG: Zn-dependent exopeptidase M28, partial [Christensenellaceae bacterium]|nr:Zn-dependent exopeptidase M28 [Christensenellaceae bacterium]
NFSNKHTVVDGANDNLSANFTATSVLKTMQEQGIEFENTEVCALMAGSEEAGLRGAYAFSKAHAEEIKNSGIETVFVVLETLKESDKLGVYDKDMCATVATNLEVCDLVQRAAVEVGAIKEGSKYQFVGIGATDAAAFSQYGLKATCLAGLDHKLRDYYHTRKDTVGNTSPECIELAYKTCMRTLEIFDKEGLKK